MRRLLLGGLLAVFGLAAAAGVRAGAAATQERRAEVRFSRHALERARERGISRKRVEGLISGQKPFEYVHHGRREQGYFDPRTGLFAAVSEDGVVITVFADATPGYVERLKREKP